MTPRPYQTQAVTQAAEDIGKGMKRPIIVAPTGAGKTVIASTIIKRCQARGTKVLFIAHRRELIEQCSAKLDDLGVDHGIIMADHWRDRPHLPVQVASVQTLVNRHLPWRPGLVFIDEAHRATASSYQAIVASFPDTPVVGLTATPVRQNGDGLGTFFTHIIECPNIRQLTDMGYLVPCEVYTWDRPSLNKAKVVRGDFQEDAMLDAMMRREIIGDMVAEWRSKASGRKTILFAINIEHSKAVVAEFAAQGVPIEHLDGETPSAIRDRILGRLRDANDPLKIVSNVGVLTEGVDIPIVSCIALCRPTTSLSLYLQMIGRGLRTFDGKTNCVILDHAGTFFWHGHPTAERQWSLSAIRKKISRTPDIVDDYKVCPACKKLYPLNTDSCECGYVFSSASKKKKTIKVREGKLTLAQSYAEKPEAFRKQTFWKYLYEQRNNRKKDGTPYSSNYAAIKYANVFRQPAPSDWVREYDTRNEFDARNK